MIRHTFHQIKKQTRMKRYTKTGRQAMDVSFRVISSTDGTHMLPDNNYCRTVVNGNFNIGNVELDLHYVQMETNGHNDHATLITVEPEIMSQQKALLRTWFRCHSTQIRRQRQKSTNQQRFILYRRSCKLMQSNQSLSSQKSG
jgi:hypothetical protein